MHRYVIKRLLLMIVIMLCAGFVVFTLTYLVPGDIAKILLGPYATEDVLKVKRAAIGVDQPYLVQLGRYMYNTFIRLDFGISWVFDSSVMDELMVRLPRTLTIGLCAMVLNVTFGTVLGIIAGRNEGKVQDSLVMIIAMVFISAPDFFVALLLILFFALKLGWMPAYGIDSWKNYILPIISISLGGIAINARQARSSMLEVIRADFVTTARAKGQKENVITRRHMLPNALMPIITGVGGGLATIVAGTPVIETVFSIPGVGAFMLSGVSQHDYPVVRACVVFFAMFTSIAILIMDLCYAYLDPRIKAQYSKRKKVA
ncbi:MAG: ABC transporter permease [Clostridiales bacterium]|nr:ABC transporter permease [Clostridiales bacterium]